MATPAAGYGVAMTTLDLILWILATLRFGIAAFAGAPATGGRFGWVGWGWLGAMLVGLSVILPG